MIWRHFLNYFMYRTFISKLIINRMLNAFAMHEMLYDEKKDAYDYKFLYVNKSFMYHTGLDKNPIGKTYRQLVDSPLEGL
jgi:hypothetical protein